MDLFVVSYNELQANSVTQFLAIANFCITKLCYYFLQRKTPKYVCKRKECQVLYVTPVCVSIGTPVFTTI